MNDFKHHLIVFAGTLLVCFACDFMRERINVRGRKCCPEVMTFPLWYKIAITVIACFIPVCVAVLAAIGKTNKDDAAIISVLAIPMGYLLLTTWTTRVSVTGTDMFMRNLFFSRHMNINLIREISKSEWRCSYKIMDVHGRKIWLSYYLSGVEILIRRIAGNS
jgi:hypothetical protein